MGSIPPVGSLIQATPYQIGLNGGLVVFPIEYYLQDKEWYVKESSPNFGFVLSPDTLILVIQIYCNNPLVLLCEHKGELYSAHSKDNDWIVVC